jgi:hypothetical protein
MRLLAVALIATIPSAALAVSVLDDGRKPVASDKDKCPQTARYYAWQRDKAVRPQKLTHLPDANAYAAVYRRVAGCEVPLVVRYGVSGR